MAYTKVTLILKLLASHKKIFFQYGFEISKSANLEPVLSHTEKNMLQTIFHEY